ncbi:MAG: 50S ribosomal protein L2 [Candidatus Campbellbacteria bacterium]
MKKYKPTTKGRRGMTGIEFRKHITHSRPHKPLTGGFKRATGRNSFGRLTTLSRGGGHKRRFRDIDFAYTKKDIPARVESVEYDPNRTGFIALLVFADGSRRYILAPQSMKVGGTFLASEKAPLIPGNRLPLAKIPVGTFVYNIEVKPDGGAKIARSAGNYAEVVAHDGGYTLLKMPSTEIRKVSEKAWGSIGEVSNPENKLVNLGKAGRKRWLGKKPKVRGTAMNPVDHPHGGGEGRQGRGHRRARTRHGKNVGKGHKTRRPKKYSNFLIVERRRVGKKRKV